MIPKKDLSRNSIAIDICSRLKMMFRERRLQISERAKKKEALLHPDEADKSADEVAKLAVEARVAKEAALRELAELKAMLGS